MSHRGLWKKAACDEEVPHQRQNRHCGGVAARFQFDEPAMVFRTTGSQPLPQNVS
jgi:hypothetical protein